MKHRLPAALAGRGRWRSPFPASTAAAKTDHHDERLDVGRPARRQARQGLPQADPDARQFRLAQGGSDVGVADVAARPRDDRQLVARPEASRPGRARLQQDRRGRASASSRTPGNPLAEPVAGADPGDLLRPGAQLEPGSRRTARPARSTWSSARPPRAPRTRSRRSSWATERRQREREPEGLERPRRSRRSRATRTRSATCRSLHRGPATRSPTRASPATCATPSPASTAACATSGWSPAAAPRGARAEVHPLDPATSTARAAIIATELGAAQLDGGARPQPALREPRPSDQRAERMLGALASLVLRR